MKVWSPKFRLGLPCGSQGPCYLKNHLLASVANLLGKPELEHRLYVLAWECPNWRPSHEDTGSPVNWVSYLSFINIHFLKLCFPFRFSILRKCHSDLDSISSSPPWCFSKQNCPSLLWTENLWYRDVSFSLKEEKLNLPDEFRVDLTCVHKGKPGVQLSFLLWRKQVKWYSNLFWIQLVAPVICLINVAELLKGCLATMGLEVNFRLNFFTVVAVWINGGFQNGLHRYHRHAVCSLSIM